MPIRSDVSNLAFSSNLRRTCTLLSMSNMNYIIRGKGIIIFIMERQGYGFQKNKNRTLTWSVRLKCIYKHYLPAACWSFFRCNQTALWTPLSISPSVCLSVTHIWPSYYHRIITIIMSIQKCKRSRQDVKFQSHRGRYKFKINFAQIWASWRYIIPVNSTKSWGTICVDLSGVKGCPIVFQVHPSKFKVTRVKMPIWPPISAFLGDNFLMYRWL